MRKQNLQRSAAFHRTCGSEASAAVKARCPRRPVPPETSELVHRNWALRPSQPPGVAQFRIERHSAPECELCHPKAEPHSNEAVRCHPSARLHDKPPMPRGGFSLKG